MQTFFSFPSELVLVEKCEKENSNRHIPSIYIPKWCIIQSCSEKQKKEENKSFLKHKSFAWCKLMSNVAQALFMLLKAFRKKE